MPCRTGPLGRATLSGGGRAGAGVLLRRGEGIDRINLVRETPEQVGRTGQMGEDRGILPR